MKRLRIITSTISIIIALFIIIQSLYISHHEKTDEFNIANPNLFTKYFDLLLVSRTLKHEKGLDYWFDWIDNEAGLITMNKKISLLHFDLHGLEDNSDEPYHICTPTNLFIYDFFIQHTLDIMYHAYFGDLDPKENENVTRHALRKGYVDNVVWLFPNHWKNYSQKIIMNTSYEKFTKMIYHQTYFINPRDGKFFYLNNEIIKDNEIWHKLFAKRKLFEPVNVELRSFDNLKVNVWVLSLNEYLNEPYFRDMNVNNIILDIDLDFFQCQEPAQTFMNHFDWNQNKINDFNNLLQHHQYVPSHMFSEYSNQAIMTLLYLLNENDTNELKSKNEPINPTKFKVPQIEDVFRIALEEKMEIETIKRVMYLLYEYQIERSYYEKDAVQHLMHFDHVFKILNIAHRRLIDLQIIGYRDSEEVLHAQRNYHSVHMEKLKEIAVRKAKKEHFIKEKRETTKIRELNENYQETFQRFEQFAQRLIDLVQQRRNLLSTEVDDLGQQNELFTNNNDQNRIYQTQWDDHQLKDLMNVKIIYFVFIESCMSVLIGIVL